MKPSNGALRALATGDPQAVAGAGSRPSHSRLWCGLALGLLLIAAFAGAEEAAPRQEITSIADWSCQAWTERRASGDRVDAPQMWLAGFLTGMAAAFQIDILAYTDAERSFAWIDRFCIAHPEEAVSSGAQAMLRELIEMLPREPPLAL